MNNKELNHAKGLFQSLMAKALDLYEEAYMLDKEKEGRSVVANRLRAEAAEARRLAHELKAAYDQEVWLGRN